MLYKGQMQEAVEKERSLTMYQLKVAKLDTEKQTEGVDGLKQANADL